MLDTLNGTNQYSNNKQEKFWNMTTEYFPKIGDYKISEYFYNKNIDLFN